MFSAINIFTVVQYKYLSANACASHGSTSLQFPKITVVELKKCRICSKKLPNGVGLP